MKAKEIEELAEKNNDDTALTGAIILLNRNLENVLHVIEEEECESKKTTPMSLSVDQSQEKRSEYLCSE